MDKKKGLILKAFQHNNNERLTIIKEGSSAITFATNEHDDSTMGIIYYIDSEICQGVQIGDDLYIEAVLKSLEKDDDDDLEDRDTTRFELTMYKVSEDRSSSLSSRRSKKHSRTDSLNEKERINKGKTIRKKTILPENNEMLIPEE